MDEKERYFGRYPIGTEIYVHLSRPCIERVVAHLESVFTGTGMPWYGVATVVVVGDKTHKGPYDINRELIRGELPEQYNIHYVGRGAVSMHARLDDMEYAYVAHNLEVVKWHKGWILYHIIHDYPGSFYEPPEPGGIFAFGSGGVGVKGNVETTFAESFCCEHCGEQQEPIHMATFLECAEYIYMAVWSKGSDREI